VNGHAHALLISTTKVGKSMLCHSSERHAKTRPKYDPAVAPRHSCCFLELRGDLRGPACSQHMTARGLCFTHVQR
jgi:hypothetical protein